jgi:methyltransferase-like protein 6
MEDISKGSEVFVGHVAKPFLTEEEVNKMQIQNLRLVTEFQALQLEKNTRKHWDLFYKRNENRFFKDRHWTTREFEELLGLDNRKKSQKLLEVGCGVGNLIYPLLECNINFEIIYACDLSPRAIEFVKVSVNIKFQY